MSIRDATLEDGAACAQIYAPYVRDTVITFELDPPSATQMAGRIASAQQSHAWLVATDAVGTVVGYAYGGPYKSRAAYRWACEVSVYLMPGLRRRGTGRALYEALFERLAQRGYRTATAGMTLPNDASVGLHRALGFDTVGTWQAVGWKNDAWHDVEWCQRSLGTFSDPPAEPH